MNRILPWLAWYPKLLEFLWNTPWHFHSCNLHLDKTRITRSVSILSGNPTLSTTTIMASGYLDSWTRQPLLLLPLENMEPELLFLKSRLWKEFAFLYSFKVLSHQDRGAQGTLSIPSRNQLSSRERSGGVERSGRVKDRTCKKKQHVPRSSLH